MDIGLTAGGVLQLVRRHGPLTRADLAAHTGLSLAAVSPRVAALTAAGLVSETRALSTGGRPAGRLTFNPAAGIVLVADLGRTHCRLGVTDLAGTPLAERAAERSLSEGPEAVLPWVLAVFAELLGEADRRPDEVLGVGIGMPGPIEFQVGRVVDPPVLPGWNGVDIVSAVQQVHPVPVVVDNDANAEAIGEYWTSWRSEASDILYVKCGTGIGCGIVVGGAIHRGAQGASGEIGHIPVSSGGDRECRCGNSGCLETVASGRALSEELTRLGHDAPDGRAVIELLRQGNPDATRLIRTAGRALGEVLAGAVDILNPAAIVVGGDLAAADETLLAGVQEAVYRRAGVLATRSLRIERGALRERAGIVGAAITVLDIALAPTAIDRMLEEATEEPA